MRRFLAILAFFAALGPIASAGAWESECRPTRVSAPDAYAYERSICTLAGYVPGQGIPKPPECADGAATARGALFGEHTYITRQAMGWAGLRAYQDDESVFDYYIDADANRQFDQWLSLEPARPGAMKARPTFDGTPSQSAGRRFSIPEFAGVPDGSYSLSDFVLGNEHCLLPYAFLEGRASDPAQIQKCHDYKSHVAQVNSTHFAPQNRHVYALYHRIALDVADRCEAMRVAFAKVPSHAAHVQMNEAVDNCEREALAFQSLASHYQADAWSTGHMWQRWGSPLMGSSDASQVAAVARGLVSGLIHGWRSVVRDEDTFDLYKYQHDPLTMPGALVPGAGLDDMVQWTYPDGSNALATIPPAKDGIVVADGRNRQLGGGDTYLLACNSKDDGGSRWAIAPAEPKPDAVDHKGIDPGGDDRPLTVQYRRMMSCIAVGFEEVWRRWKTKTPSRVRGVPDDQFDPAVQSSIGSDTAAKDDVCWAQRATNKSMYLGAGMSTLGSFATIDPEWLARATIDTIPYLANAKGDLGKAGKAWAAFRGGLKAAFEGHGPFDAAAFRKQLASLGLLFQRWAYRNPYGTELADLNVPDAFDTDELGLPVTLSTYLSGERQPSGSPTPTRNDAFASLIDTRAVPYLEAPDLGRWAAVKDRIKPGADCTNDAICPVSDANGSATFCDRGGSCFPHEVSTLRAFRRGEMGLFCRADTKDELEAAMKPCHLTAYNTVSAACDACAKLLVPHMRNACNATSYALTDGVDRRSACDVLFASPEFQSAQGIASFDPHDLDANSVYAPFDSGAGAYERALEICRLADKLPTAGPAPETPPDGNATFFNAGTAACFRGCDTCTTCVGVDAMASLQSVPGFGTLATTHLYGDLSDLIDVAGDGFRACGVRADHSVWCVGVNYAGQLGNGTTTSSTSPVVTMVPGSAKRVYMANDGACAITDNNALVCWGRNGNGEIGIKPPPPPGFVLTPQGVAGDVVEFSELGTRRCVRSSGGGVRCWDADSIPFALPTAVTGLTDATQIAGSCALVGGAVRCWDDIAVQGTCAPPCCPDVLYTVSVPGLGEVKELAVPFENGTYCGRDATGIGGLLVGPHHVDRPVRHPDGGARPILVPAAGRRRPHQRPLRDEGRSSLRADRA
jgi:hypothetical protein